MSRKDVELIKAETRRLEALGVVLGMLGLNTLEPKRGGRPKLYETEAERKRAYRNRKAAKPLSIVREGQRTRSLKKVRDIDLAQKAKSQSNRNH
jgi:hypothetical protein